MSGRPSCSSALLSCEFLQQIPYLVLPTLYQEANVSSLLSLLDEVLKFVERQFYTQKTTNDVEKTAKKEQ